MFVAALVSLTNQFSEHCKNAMPRYSAMFLLQAMQEIAFAD